MLAVMVEKSLPGLVLKHSMDFVQHIWVVGMLARIRV